MRKRILTLLVSLMAMGMAHAQVIFDPDNYTNLELPSGMSIVAIDGTNYLKTTLDGWNSMIAVSPTTVNIDAASTKFKFKAKYEVKSNVLYTAADSLAMFVQIFSGTSGKALGHYQGSASADFATYVADFDSTSSAGSVQLAAMITSQGWNAATNDTLYLGEIEAYDPDAVNVDSVLFDPATFSGTLGSGMEIVTVGDKQLLKVTLNEWSSSISLPETINSGEYNMIYAECYWEGAEGTTYTADSLRLTVQANGADGSLFGTEITPAPTTLTKASASASANSDVTGLQFYSQSVNTWSAVSGEIMYVGRVTLGSKVYEKAVPPATASLVFGTVEVDGLMSDAAWDNSAEYTVANIATGTVDGKTTADGDTTVEANDDSYGLFYMLGDKDNFYIFVDITDNDPLSMGDSESPWLNDGIEMFIDIADNRYVGQDRLTSQHQIRLNIDQDVDGKLVISSDKSWLVSNGVEVDNDTTKLTYVGAINSGGYTMEIAIPWTTWFRNSTNTNATAYAEATADGALYEGKAIAFELSILDASAVDTRKSILNWANNTGDDVAYTTNEYYGQITLTGTDWGVGIKENKASLNTVKVYPNPVNSELTIDMENVASVEVYNLVGASVLKTTSENVINVSNLEMGVYILRATDTNGKVSVAKFNKN